jgi:NADPH2:quinone reductase
MQSRAIRIHGPGRPDVLRLESIEVGDPGPGEVLMRNTAIGVNFIDTYQRSGLYPVKLPAVLGSEAAGVVEAVGPGVTGVSVGDRVAVASGPIGAYAERRLVPAERLVPLPASISDDVAAASLLKGLTVEYLIRRTFAVQRGQTVLFHAAAGGVGTIATQWLAHLGATVIGTVGSDEKAAVARSRGCTHAIVYTREDFAERVRQITGGAGVPVVYDSVGKATIAKSLDCLAPRGLLVSFGNASGKPEPLDLLVLSQKGSLYVTRPTLATYVAKRDDLLAAAAALFEVIASGAVNIDAIRKLPLEAAAEAHRALESRGTTGSLVLVP